MMPWQANLLAVAVSLQLVVGCTSPVDPSNDALASASDTIHTSTIAEGLSEQTTSATPTIQGRWFMNQVTLDFDTVTWLLTTDGIPPLPFQLDGDSITVYETHDGELATGRIRRLTHEELRIRWTTGDSDVYHRRWGQ